MQWINECIVYFYMQQENEKIIFLIKLRLML